MAKTDLMNITDNDMPGLFIEADRASLAAQKSYLKLIKLQLILLVFIPAVASLTFLKTSSWDIRAVLLAVLLACSLAVTLIIRVSKKERVWYEGRAIAESVKTLTWRYAACAEPFINSLSSGEADEVFKKELEKVFEGRKSTCTDFIKHTENYADISGAVRKFRELSLEERKKTYLTRRIKNQQDWYWRKSGFNRKTEVKWFNAICISQGIAICLAVLCLFWNKADIAAAGIFSSAALAFLAWLQLKQHQTLAQSYAITANELDTIQEIGRQVNTESELSKFVLEAERAISREHTLWTARRE